MLSELTGSEYLTKKTPEPEPVVQEVSLRVRVRQSIVNLVAVSLRVKLKLTMQKRNASRKEQIKQSKRRMSFNPRWVDKYPWVRHDLVIVGAFCTICEKWEKPPPQVRGIWIHQPFRAWRKAMEKMQEHAKSNWHREASLLALEYERSQREGTVVEQSGSFIKATT